MGADASLGFFNKGRASRKKAVNSRQQTGELCSLSQHRQNSSNKEAIFDEDKFLESMFTDVQEKKPRERAKKKSQKMNIREKIGSDEEGARESVDANSNHSRQQQKTEQPKKGSIITISSNKSTEIQVDENKSADDEKTSNYASEIWDIEREFLPNQKEADSVIYKKPHSVVVDCTRQDWGLQQGSEDTLTGKHVLEDEAGGAHIESQSESNKQNTLETENFSSLAPSQSASQVNHKKSEEPGMISHQMTSKFFTANETLKRTIGNDYLITTNHRQTLPMKAFETDRSLIKQDSNAELSVCKVIEDLGGTLSDDRTELKLTDATHKISVSESLLEETLGLHDYFQELKAPMPTPYEVAQSSALSLSDILECPWAPSEYVSDERLKLYGEQDETYELESLDDDEPYDTLYADTGDLPAPDICAGDYEEAQGEDPAYFEDIYGFIPEGVSTDIEYSEQEFEGPFPTSDKRACSSMFLQGRALLLGLDGMSAETDDDNAAPYYTGCLKAIESRVAEELQKQWYPMRH